MPRAITLLTSVLPCVLYSQSLQIGGRVFHLGMTKQEVLQIAPVSQSSKSDLMSTETIKTKYGEPALWIKQDGSVVGTVFFQGGRAIALSADWAYITKEQPESAYEFVGLLANMLNTIVESQPAQVTIQARRKDGQQIIIDDVSLKSGPYTITLSRWTGLGGKHKDTRDVGLSVWLEKEVNLDNSPARATPLR